MDIMIIIATASTIEITIVTGMTIVMDQSMDPVIGDEIIKHGS